MALISVRAVTKRYGVSVALRGVDLEVGAGEGLALFGHNGSGKTTLLKLVAGLLRPTSGTVTVDGSPPRAARSRIGYVGHQPYLYPYLSVAENLVFYARLYAVAPTRAVGLLDAVGMAGKRDALVHTLSRGETQRVSLARALLHDPELLLADEPFSGLDRAAAASLPGLLRREGRTLIVASHDPAQALAVCDRALTLERGRIVPDPGPPPPPRQAGERPAARRAGGGP